MSPTLAELERAALMLPRQDRAQLAETLWNSLAGLQGMDVVMTGALERLLDEGLEDWERARTTADLRGRG